jgi:ribosomal protein S20
VQVASAADPAAAAIGTLSAGGDSAAQSQQQARDLIASLVKRIATLSAKTIAAERRQISQVQNFIRQAQKALDSGDAEGARNLATKAKLLMDDLETK